MHPVSPRPIAVLLPLLLAGCATTGGPRGAGTGPTVPVLASVPTSAEPGMLAIAPDGSRVYAASGGELIAIATDTNAEVARLRIAPYPVAVSFGPDGRSVYVTNLFSTSLTVVDTTTNQPAPAIELMSQARRGGYGRAAVSPDGRTVWVPNQTDSEIVAKALDGRDLLRTVPLDLRPADVAFAPDGRRAYTCGCKEFCVTGSVEVLDTTTNRLIDTITVGPLPYRIALTATGARAYTVNGNGPTVSVIDLAGGTVVATVPVGAGPTGLAVTRDGTRIYVASQDAGTVTVIDGTSNTVIGTAAVGPSPREVVVSPDGRRVWVSTKRAVVAVDASALVAGGAPAARP